MNSAHVKIVSEWSYSKSYWDIQVFLEFYNFYWYFIYNFSDIVKSLQDLLWELKNNKKSDQITDHEWQTFQQKAFWQLIDAFISASVLHHYSLLLFIWLETDASSTVCADILFLLWENSWHSITYCLKKFSGTEIHYSIHDKKFLIIVWSFKQW